MGRGVTHVTLKRKPIVLGVHSPWKANNFSKIAQLIRKLPLKNVRRGYTRFLSDERIPYGHYELKFGNVLGAMTGYTLNIYISRIFRNISG